VLTRSEVCLLVCAILSTAALAQAQRTDTTLGAAGKTWRFAVSGDSRNCGDVVMPAIAKKAHADGVSFYWHLGDFRAIYDFDQDYRQIHPKANILAYETSAWPDFIEHQLLPFGNLPIYLSFGNHETFSPKTRTDALLQFADWFNTTELKTQRLHDDPNAHLLRSYYHWIKAGVDFITLDNASDEQFDDDQLTWFSSVIDRAAKAPEIRTVVVGMHKALPDGLSTGHSMNDSAAGTASGRVVYRQLVDFRSQTGKNVYVLASHSHFFLDNLYNTACRRQHPNTILPGWIVGTAGAVRHRLPADTSGAKEPKTDAYGYLLGDVASDGTIQFQFRPISETDVPAETKQAFTPDFVGQCFTGNSSPYVPEGPAQPPNCP
jgi:calcineurin-like phosphoesterase family protein